jgi:hypothetical protein
MPYVLRNSRCSFLSDVVFRYKALCNFLVANPMLQKIVAGCDIKSISRAAIKIFWSRLTYLGVSREATKLFRHIATPSLVLHILYGCIHAPGRPPSEPGHHLTEFSIVQSGVAVMPFLIFLQEASSYFAVLSHVFGTLVINEGAYQVG